METGKLTAGESAVWRRALGWFLKLLGVLAGVGLVWWTIRRTGAAPWSALREGDWLWLTGACVSIGFSHVFGSWRWGLGLAVQGVHCSWWLLYRLTLAGMFFSQLIPGAVSGDVLKLAWIVRQNPGKGPAAVMSGIVDRMVGVAGLFLIAALGGGVYWLCAPGVFQENRVVRLAFWAVLAGCCVFLGGLWVLVYHGLFLKVRWIARIVDWVGQRLPAGLVHLVTRLCLAAGAYRRRPAVLAQILALSMTIHFFLGVALFCVGRGLGEASYGFGAYFLGLQLSNAVTLLPVTPGGLGLRDSVSQAFFQSYGEGDLALTGTIPVVYSLITVAWTLLGVFALLSLRQAKRE